VRSTLPAEPGKQASQGRTASAPGPLGTTTAPATAGQAAAGQPAPGRPEARHRRGRAATAATAVLVVALIAGIAIGPVAMPLSAIAGSLAGHLPWHPALAVPPVDSAIIWQIRLPRVVLGALVGSMLAGGGAAYQGVFRNPLADPYLLGVAAGAGLGATAVIISGASPVLLPVAAFGGAAGAVALTYSLGAGAGRAGEDAGPLRTAGTASILLAGVAVSALLTAAQTYLQQSHAQTLQSIYAWILGGLSGATWNQVWLIIPYVLVSAVTLLAHRRLLDVLRVGET
jgi:iron complex transport system permease protein